ncbi:MAG: nucleotidyltransferase-like protein, partial [Paenibacillus sp.]|nr:nucleotidyltransferase-like protein [Paenibacillus sp.]
MDFLKQQIKLRYEHDSKLTGTLVVSNPAPFSPLVDGLDYLVLIVRDQDNLASTITHYIKDGYRIQERGLNSVQLEQWMMYGPTRSVIQWMLQGEIVMDPHLYMEGLLHKLIEYPMEMRRQQLQIEFSHFLRSYLQSKQYLQDGHVLDAYSNVLAALCHWARIAIIEEGIHPEVLVWAQVRRLNPGVYKLYDELTSNEESLEQRVRLVVLACEFSVMSMMESCCYILLNVIKSRQDPWSLSELAEVQSLKELNLELPLLIAKMSRKELIKEVAYSEDDSFILELR